MYVQISEVEHSNCHSRASELVVQQKKQGLNGAGLSSAEIMGLADLAQRPRISCKPCAGPQNLLA